MPPKTRFTKDMVIDSAFELIKNRGVHFLSARNIASILGSSTAPIYSYFNTIEELRDSALKKAFAILSDYITKEYSNRQFLNLGLGILLFARDYPYLYKALFIDIDEIKEFQEKIYSDFTRMTKSDARFKDLKKNEANKLMMKMWMFTHGYSTLICSNMSVTTDLNDMKTFLEEVGNAIINDSLDTRQHNKKRKDQTLSLF